jgi:hypothetical protein
MLYEKLGQDFLSWAAVKVDDVEPVDIINRGKMSFEQDPRAVRRPARKIPKGRDLSLQSCATERRHDVYAAIPFF